MKEMQETNKTTLPKKKVAIIWTRVSSPAQTEGLIEKIESCKEYANNNDIEVTHQVTMIGSDTEFPKKHYELLFELITRNPDVNTILVKGYDRLARADATSIVIKSFLKSKGVNILSITQEVKDKGVVEELMESMFLLYSQLENNFCMINNNAFKENNHDKTEEKGY